MELKGCEDEGELTEDDVLKCKQMCDEYLECPTESDSALRGVQGSLKRMMTCFSFMRDTVRKLKRQLLGLDPTGDSGDSEYGSEGTIDSGKTESETFGWWQRHKQKAAPHRRVSAPSKQNLLPRTLTPPPRPSTDMLSHAEKQLTSTPLSDLGTTLQSVGSARSEHTTPRDADGGAQAQLVHNLQVPMCNINRLILVTATIGRCCCVFVDRCRCVIVDRCCCVIVDRCCCVIVDRCCCVIVDRCCCVIVDRCCCVIVDRCRCVIVDRCCCVIVDRCCCVIVDRCCCVIVDRCCCVIVDRCCCVIVDRCCCVIVDRCCCVIVDRCCCVFVSGVKRSIEWALKERLPVGPGTRGR